VKGMHVIINVGSDGDIKCFCPYEEYLQGKCECRDKYDCPEAILEVKTILGTRPSEQTSLKRNAADRELKTAERKIKRHTQKIKEATAKFEKSIKNIRFKP